MLGTFFSEKIGGPALKYVFAINCRTGEIVWVSGAYPGGESEYVIVRTELEGIMWPGERFLGDRFFRNFTELFITPPVERTQLSIMLQAIRSNVERKIGRLKSFFLFDIPYRSMNYQQHKKFVHNLCKIHNLLNKE